VCITYVQPYLLKLASGPRFMIRLWQLPRPETQPVTDGKHENIVTWMERQRSNTETLRWTPDLTASALHTTEHSLQNDDRVPTKQTQILYDCRHC